MDRPRASASYNGRRRKPRQEGCSSAGHDVVRRNTNLRLRLPDLSVGLTRYLLFSRLTAEAEPVADLGPVWPGLHS